MCYSFFIEMKKILSIFLILSLGGAFSFPANAFDKKEDFPKIANYYLQPLVPKDHYDDLAKYDLLILDVDTQTIDTSLFSQIKHLNPETQFLAYIPSQSVNTQDLSSWARFRNMTNDKVNQENWWLRDSSGNVVGLGEPWPTIKFVDPGKGWAGYLSDLAKNDVANRDIWDGIFYDMVFANIDWLNSGDIDIDQDGQKDDPNSINQYWQTHIQDLLDKTSSKVNKVILINLDKINSYESNLDGFLMENLPSPHLASNWPDLINYYLNNHFSKIKIINANTNNAGHMGNYQKMRFGLTSTLLGNGYYSFDFGDQNHGQVWWYDEYNINLGKAISNPVNLLDQNNSEIKPGLWRRDFEQGISLINSTGQKQTYVFQNEQFEKINGTQDRRVNNGTKINLVTIDSNDGIVLLKTNQEIRNSDFKNGSFVRVFNKEGQQTQNGFFAFKSQFPGNVQILVTDLDNDNQDETLVNGNGIISIYKNDRKIKEFKPYDFEGDVCFSIGDIYYYGCYDIVTGPGVTGGPHVKVLNQYGNTINEFMAYDERFRGGVNLSLGDVNDDGYDEIITGAGPTGGPHVKVFNRYNTVLNEFMAYDENNRDGIMIMSDDLDNDNINEILVGIINF